MNHLETVQPKQIYYNDLNEEIVEDIADPKSGFLSFILGIFKGPFKSDKKIGELNGKWAIGLKLLIVLFFFFVPTFFTWATWVTSGIYNSNSHICITDSLDYEGRLKEVEKSLAISLKLEEQLNKLHDKIDALPHPDWRRRIELLETQFIETRQEVIAVDKKNVEDHQKMSLLLESIKTKVDMLK